MAAYVSFLFHIVNQGGGNSNTGNVARRFFSNPEMASAITEINFELIRRIGCMLQALNSGFKINTTAYKIFGKETAMCFVEHYEWYYMPQSMHRLFFHVPEIAEVCPVTIGESSEEPLETSHKYVKHALNHHARQHSYLAANQDIGHYRLMQTDPNLNEISKSYKPNCVKKLKGLS